MNVYQQGCMAVASHSFVYGCESIFGAEVNVSTSLRQDPDGLTSTRLTLHRQGQSSLWRTHTHRDSNRVFNGQKDWFESQIIWRALARLFAPRGPLEYSVGKLFQQYISTIYTQALLSLL